MGRCPTRRLSKRLRSHPLFTLVSVFLLIFSHSPLFKNCKLVLHRKIKCVVARKYVVTGMHIVSLAGGQILKICAIIRLVGQRQAAQCLGVQDCDSRCICGLSGNFIWANDLSGSCLEVPSSAKESSQVWDSGEGFRCCSLFRSSPRDNGLTSRGSEVTTIFRQTFRVSSVFCSRTTSTSTSQKKNRWKANTIRIWDQDDQLSQGRCLWDQWKINQ